MGDERVQDRARAGAAESTDTARDDVPEVPARWAAVAPALFGGPEVRRRIDGGDRLGGSTVDDQVASTLRRRRGHGEPLPAHLADDLGARFGTDLSAVRVHNDQEAGAISRRLDATAFTQGDDVYFAPGAYRPESGAGREVLAHELAHVVQARSGPSTGAAGSPVIGRADDPAESAADDMARIALSGGARPATPSAPSTGSLRRLQSRSAFADDSSEGALTGAGTAKKHLLRLLARYEKLTGGATGSAAITALVKRQESIPWTIGSALSILAEIEGTVDKWVKDRDIAAVTDSSGAVIEAGTTAPGRAKRMVAFMALKDQAQKEQAELITAITAAAKAASDGMVDLDDALQTTEDELATARSELDAAETDVAATTAALEKSRARLTALRADHAAKAKAATAAQKAVTSNAKSAASADSSLAALKKQHADNETTFGAMSAGAQQKKKAQHQRTQQALEARIAAAQAKLDKQAQRKSAAASATNARDTAAAALRDPKSSTDALTDDLTAKQDDAATKRDTVDKKEAAKQEAEASKKAAENLIAGLAAVGGARDVSPEGQKTLQHYEDKANEYAEGTSSFDALGAKLDALVANDGDAATIDFVLDLPVGSGAGLLGVSFNARVARGGGLTTISAQLAIRGGGQIPGAGKIVAALGAYIESAGATGVEAARLLSYAMYRRFRESNGVPAEVSNKFWGGDWGEAGQLRADRWSRNVEARVLNGKTSTKPGPLKPDATPKERAAHRKAVSEWAPHYVVSGGSLAAIGEFGIKLSETTGVGIGGEAEGRLGTRIDALSLEDKGGAGKANKKSSGFWAKNVGAVAKAAGYQDRGAERSVGRGEGGFRAKASGSFSAQLPEPLGTTGGSLSVEGSMAWTATGHRSKRDGTTNPEHRTELTKGLIEIVASVGLPAIPVVGSTVEDLISAATERALAKLPASYWEQEPLKDVQGNEVKASYLMRAVKAGETGGSMAGFKEWAKSVPGGVSTGGEFTNPSAAFTPMGDSSGASNHTAQSHNLTVTISIDFVARETVISFSRANTPVGFSVPGFLSVSVGTEKAMGPPVTHKWS